MAAEPLTMLARAIRVDWTWVWFVFSKRSLASKMSWGFTPYLVMALMKLPMFSSCKTGEARQNAAELSLRSPPSSCLSNGFLLPQLAYWEAAGALQSGKRGGECCKRKSPQKSNRPMQLLDVGQHRFCPADDCHES